MIFLTRFKKFITGMAYDERIPKHDKRILLILIILVISPMDFIPDWIPIYGLLDDVMILSIILDYLFSVLDSRIPLSHFPWGMKSFARVRAIGRFMQKFVPTFIKKRLWHYVGDLY